MQRWVKCEIAEKIQAFRYTHTCYYYRCHFCVNLRSKLLTVAVYFHPSILYVNTKKGVEVAALNAEYIQVILFLCILILRQYLSQFSLNLGLLIQVGKPDIDEVSSLTNDGVQPNMSPTILFSGMYRKQFIYCKGIRPIINKDLGFIYRSDCSDHIRVYSQASVLYDKIQI